MNQEITTPMVVIPLSLYNELIELKGLRGIKRFKDDDCLNQILTKSIIEAWPKDAFNPKKGELADSEDAVLEFYYRFNINGTKK